MGEVYLECPLCETEMDAYADTSSLDGNVYDGCEFCCPSCGCDGHWTQFDEDGESVFIPFPDNNNESQP